MPRLEVELRRRAPALDLDVVGLVGSDGNRRIRRVGRRHQQVARVRLDRLQVRLEPGDPLVDQADLLLGRLGLVALAVLHERADRLGRLVALRLQAPRPRRSAARRSSSSDRNASMSQSQLRFAIAVRTASGFSRTNRASSIGPPRTCWSGRPDAGSIAEAPLGAGTGGRPGAPDRWLTSDLARKPLTNRQQLPIPTRGHRETPNRVENRPHWTSGGTTRSRTTSNRTPGRRWMTRPHRRIAGRSSTSARRSLRQSASE